MNPLQSQRREITKALVLGAIASATLSLKAQTAAAAYGPSPMALPKAVALSAELSGALAKGQPLVVMVSLAGCPYCKIARENYLLPLLRSNAVQVVQVDMQSKAPLKDFQGQLLSHDLMIERWRIAIAPTLLFFGKGGREVAERLVGGYLPDFYGAYLQDRLETAQRAI
jgi:thioredoxin-related protein